MQVCQKPHSADGEQWCALSIWPGLGPSRIRSKHWQLLQMILANTLSITVFKPDDCTLDCFIDLWYVLLEFDTLNSVQVERLAFGKRNLFPPTAYYVISKLWRSFSSPGQSLARIWLNLCAHICLPTFAAARQAGRARLINHEKNKHIATQIPPPLRNNQKEYRDRIVGGEYKHIAAISTFLYRLSLAHMKVAQLIHGQWISERT